MLIIKSGKRETTVRIEVLNQESMRTLGEKKNYKYFRILEADTIKQAEMKEKKKKEKSASGEKENVSKPNSVPKISSKE